MNQSFTSFNEFKKRYPIRPNDKDLLLGSGSYGRVFKVEDQLETEWVAIKISEFKGNDTKSLKAEVDLAQRVPRQANIARYDACYRLETDTSVSDFAIMKYYPDGNLADLLRHETLTPAQILDITRGILLGLQHLHRHRIVHRDFKPANILISRDNSGRFIPKIADFGLSKLVADEELDSSDFDLSDGRGTPSYKAPEQIEGSRVSFNLDLWAFGVILYEIMTGEKPFRSDLRNSSEQSVRREIEKKIMSVELPTRVNQIVEPYQAIIRRCLVRDIHDRARKEEELLDLLDEIPQLLSSAGKQADSGQYEKAVALYEQVLAKREHHLGAAAGLDQCRSLLTAQDLASFLNEADFHVANGQFDEAKASYEQVLRLDPMHPVAARGLAFCVDRLQPEPAALRIMAVPEGTDLYEERTDAYKPTAFASVDTQEVPVTNNLLVAEPIKAVSDVRISQANQSIVEHRAGNLPKPALPWKVIAPVGIGLMALVFFYSLKTTSPVTTDRDRTDVSVVTDPEKAGITPTTPKRDESVSEEKITSTPPPNLPTGSTNEAAIAKRIGIALDKARQAYAEKNYELVIVLTNSALQLDPTRQEVVAMREAAKAAQNRANDGEKKEVTPDLAKTELVKPPVAEPVVEKEKPTNEKQQAQEKYDQLIDNGIKGIARSNNKTKAIADFTSAQALAKEHGLNTDKADAAYAGYVGKADRFLDREEYDGAKGWYTVAQAIKDTPDIRRKIKQCINQ